MLQLKDEFTMQFFGDFLTDVPKSLRDEIKEKGLTALSGRKTEIVIDHKKNTSVLEFLKKLGKRGFRLAEVDAQHRIGRKRAVYTTRFKFVRCDNVISQRIEKVQPDLERMCRGFLWEVWAYNPDGNKPIFLNLGSKTPSQDPGREAENRLCINEGIIRVEHRKHH